MLSNKIQEIISGNLIVEQDEVEISKGTNLCSLVDKLVYNAVFGTVEDKVAARWLIWEVARLKGIIPSSINDLYMARGKEELPLDFTVPAINLRALTYDSAKTVFNTAKKLNAGAFIFELARSEMGYTDQSPSEYITTILAAAIKTGWEGPVFIQGDHFQTKKASPGVPAENEIEIIKLLIQEAIHYGFFNIDIDTSTLVDLEKPTEAQQQEPNIKYSVELAKSVREIEPKGITISLGGEIGHIGGKNSTVEDFTAYVEGFNAKIGSVTGMSKISIQTGTSHGGVVLPDGTLADINVDFGVLLTISRACRQLGMGGAVQHGASTLPDEYFNQFTKSEAVEVHLATGFQNLIMDHKDFPKKLLEEIYSWLDENKQSEKGEGQTDEQFYYKLRKKALGQFKKDCWNIEKGAKDKIMADLEKRFEFLFTQLNIIDSKKYVSRTIKPVEIKKCLADFSLDTVTKGAVKGLSD